MPPRRKAHDADLARVDSPFGGIFAHGAKHSAHIGQRYFAVSVRHPVAQDDGRNSVFVQPAGYVDPLALVANTTVTAPGQDDDALSVRLVRRRTEQEITGTATPKRTPSRSAVTEESSPLSPSNFPSGYNGAASERMLRRSTKRPATKKQVFFSWKNNL